MVLGIGEDKNKVNNEVEEGHVPEENKDDESQSPSILEKLGLADQSALAYVGIFFSGIILLISLTVGDGLNNTKYYEYGITVACVASFFSFVGWAMGRFDLVDDDVAMYNNYFLFVWCFIGACFLTFGSPFKTTGNGYFASWGLALFSVMALGVTSSHMEHAVANGVGSGIGLLASAIITLVALISETFDKNDGDEFFGVICCIFTILVLTGFFYMEKGDEVAHKLKFPVMIVFSVMWIILASLLTFRGPFLTTGNGYFGVWFGAVTAVFAANAASEVSSTPAST